MAGVLATSPVGLKYCVSRDSSVVMMKPADHWERDDVALGRALRDCPVQSAGECSHGADGDDRTAHGEFDPGDLICSNAETATQSHCPNWPTAWPTTSSPNDCTSVPPPVAAGGARTRGTGLPRARGTIGSSA
jgi:hypothetical protein